MSADTPHPWGDLPRIGRRTSVPAVPSVRSPQGVPADAVANRPFLDLSQPFPQAAAEARPIVPQGVALGFVPSRVFGLIARAAVLMLFTFGLYRFWFITDLRSRLWSSTVVEGSPLEYIGTARELLIGFLVALAVVLPLNVLVFAGSLGFGLIHPLLSGASVVILYFFGLFAQYRARRYRLTRTLWRGIRFWMTGSGWGFAFRAAGWNIATLLSLGLLLPWHLAALERYRMRHTWFGDRQGSFVGSGWDLFKRGFLAWLFAIIGIGSMASYLLSSRGMRLIFEAAPIAALGTLVVLAICAVWLLPLITRWRLSGIRFGAASLHCSFGSLVFFWKHLQLGLVAVAWFAFVGAVATAAIQGYVAAKGIDVRLLLRADIWRIAPPELVVMAGIIVLSYLVGILGFGACRHYFLTVGLWRETVEATRISGLETLDDVRQRGQASDSIGAGLADALDVGGV